MKGCYFPNLPFNAASALNAPPFSSCPSSTTPASRSASAEGIERERHGFRRRLAQIDRAAFHLDRVERILAQFDLLARFARRDETQRHRFVDARRHGIARRHACLSHLGGHAAIGADAGHVAADGEAGRQTPDRDQPESAREPAAFLLIRLDLHRARLSADRIEPLGTGEFGRGHGNSPRSSASSGTVFNAAWKAIRRSRTCASACGAGASPRHRLRTSAASRSPPSTPSR